MTINYLLSMHTNLSREARRIKSDFLINDDTDVYISDTSKRYLVYRHKWYDDYVLRFADHEIISMHYNLQLNVLRITVRGEVSYE